MAVFHRASEQFEVADGEFIHPQVIVAVNPLNGRDVLQVRMLCVFQVMQYRTSRDNAIGHFFNAKAFQRMGIEMFQQAFGGISFVEYPAFEGIGIKARTIYFLEVLLVIALKNNLCRFQRL